MKLKLVIEQGRPEGAALTVGEGEFVVGRSHAAALRLGEPDVSGKHLRITRSGDRITVENLSRFGTQLDGTPLSEPATLAPGNRLQIGKGTVLLLESVDDDAAVAEGLATGTGDEDSAGAATAPDADETSDEGDRTAQEPVPAAEDATGAAPLAPDPGAVTGGFDFESSVGKAFADDATSAAPVPGAADDETGFMDDDEHTRELATRIPAAEELEFLRGADRKRARNRVFGVLGAVVVFLGLCIYFWPRTPKQEAVIDWPQDGQGNYLEAVMEAPQGGYSIIYPNADAEIESGDGTVRISALVGVNLDVEMMILLSESSDKQVVNEDVAQTIERWKVSVSEEGGRWTFDAPLHVPIFLGGENGVPVTFMSYQRIEEGSWYGTARIFRSGQRVVVLRAEVPAAERVRAEDLLHSLFLKAGKEFVRRHWEGAAEIPDVPAAELVEKARLELKRDAPATWAMVQDLLFGALRRAVLDGQPEVEAEALKWLSNLREKQALWFNEMQFARMDALQLDDEDAASAVAAPCKLVFFSPDDQRFYEVRRW